jgi:hypothetical protein
MAEPPKLEDHKALLIDAPLYTPFVATISVFRTLMTEEVRVDGQCVLCSDKSTFRTDDSGTHSYRLRNQSMHQAGGVERFLGGTILQFECTRIPRHKVYFCVYSEKFEGDFRIQKVGQYPSYADILQDAYRKYRRVFPSKQDEAEFYKALGLAAHGVGIGSFVYLRRIFERLIRRRFNDFKDAENWADEEFNSRRMDERIDLMRNHLPSFMVDNRRIFSILSVGVHELHELEEAQCLSLSGVMQSSILIILEEDERKRQDLEMRAMLEREIAVFERPKAQGGEGA